MDTTIFKIGFSQEKRILVDGSDLRTRTLRSNVEWAVGSQSE
jgi:hypothetical protein